MSPVAVIRLLISLVVHVVKVITTIRAIYKALSPEQQKELKEDIVLLEQACIKLQVPMGGDGMGP